MPGADRGTLRLSATEGESRASQPGAAARGLRRQRTPSARQALADGRGPASRPAAGAWPETAGSARRRQMPGRLQGGRPVSVEAMSWALNLAPAPRGPWRQAEQRLPKPVLIGLANHANPDGTAVFPSVKTLVR